MSLLIPFPFWVAAEQKKPGLKLIYRWLSFTSRALQSQDVAVDWQDARANGASRANCCHPNARVNVHLDPRYAACKAHHRFNQSHRAFTP